MLVLYTTKGELIHSCEPNILAEVLEPATMLKAALRFWQLQVRRGQSKNMN